MYLHCLEASWRHYHAQTQRPFSEYDYFCYHTVCRLAESGHKHLLKINETTLDATTIEQQIQPESLIYNRITGNSYTAAVYMALISLAENSEQNLNPISASESMPMARVAWQNISAEHLYKAIQHNLPKLIIKECWRIDVSLIMLNTSNATLHDYPTDGSEYHTPHEQKGQSDLPDYITTNACTSFVL